MTPLNLAPAGVFKSVRFVLTDMDETLTFDGRLAASTYAALEKAQCAGLVVIPVTAAPAGWCDQMARMWPVDAVIGENGGLFIRRNDHGAHRTYWSAEPDADRRHLTTAIEQVKQRFPQAALADDQPFRLTTVAFQITGDRQHDEAIESCLRDNGLRTTQNNLWILGWPAGFDKLAMARRVLGAAYNLDIDKDGDAVLYVGDSTNDAPMFDFFRHAVGVSTVRKYLGVLPTPPAWITRGPGGAGFVEVIDHLLVGSPAKLAGSDNSGK
jgi:HAD superfamily hydrolase (TIGR01484 family)